MDDMYKEIIMDYYRSPPNKGRIEKADITSHDSNPICGDSIGVDIKVDGDKIKQIKFYGSGCAISQAAVSMLCEKLENKKLKYAKNVTKDDIIEMLGINLIPVRLKCAILGMHVIKKAIDEYEKK